MTARTPIITARAVLQIVNANPGLTVHDLKRDFGPTAVRIATGLLRLRLITHDNPYAGPENEGRRYWPIAAPAPNTFGAHPKTGAQPMNPLFNSSQSEHPETTQRPLLEGNPDETPLQKLPDETISNDGEERPRQDEVDSSGGPA